MIFSKLLRLIFSKLSVGIGYLVSSFVFFFFLLLALKSPRQLQKPQPMDLGDRNVGEGSTQPMQGRGCCQSRLYSALGLTMPCWGAWETFPQDCAQMPTLLGMKTRERRASPRLRCVPHPQQPSPLSHCVYDAFCR